MPDRPSVTRLVLGALLTLCSASQAIGASMPEPAAPRVLVVLGASYAGGWGTPTLPGFDRVTNRGVGGDETGDMLRRLPTDVVALRPTAVLIWGHINNISRAKADRKEAAKKKAREDFDRMVSEARTAGIEVILATEIPWTEKQGLWNDFYGWVARLLGKTSYAERVSGHVEDVNSHLRALAAREKLRLLDFGKAFSNERGTRRPEYSAEDGSHISAAGYQALTDYAKRELAKAK